MKLINFKKLVLVATLIVVIFTGCKTDFDINASQENLSAGSINYRDVLPSTMATTAKIVAADWKFLQNWMGYWARSGSYQNDNEDHTSGGPLVFGPKYFYGYGRTYMLNVYLTF